MITNASNKPNTAATTPSIGAEISAGNPSRVAGSEPADDPDEAG